MIKPQVKATIIWIRNSLLNIIRPHSHIWVSEVGLI